MPLVTRSAAAVALVLLGATQLHAQDGCRLGTTDSAWVASALGSWTRIAAREAGAAVRRPPTLVLFDKRCTHTLEPLRGAGEAGLEAAHLRFAVKSVAHRDSVALPNDTRIPPGLTSFAAPQPDGRMFFVMSLPAIWLESGRGPRADLLPTAVFMHEFTHTQTVALAARVDTLVARGLPEDVDDDVIQKRFGPRAGNTKLYERERDMLFAAATAPTIDSVRTLATSAIKAIDARRANWFTGRDSVYAEAEDVFLSLEGMGQWLAWKWLIDPKGGAMPETEALPNIRRGGRQWSQDEGLALLLVVSRLSDRAPMALFRERPKTILEALRELTVPPPLPSSVPGVAVMLQRGAEVSPDDSTALVNAFVAGLQRERRARHAQRVGFTASGGFEVARYMLLASAVTANGATTMSSTLVDVQTGVPFDRAVFTGTRAQVAEAADSLGARLARVVELLAAQRQ